ncbi:TonB-dependent receptor plug domain-containing protein [Caulobacter sp. UC70_42]|uniref:STN domain-containing protein n=1 Tax=Caulobacter sp. UC70_42 TaxID=3374551 RepID=UPI003756ADE8
MTNRVSHAAGLRRGLMACCALLVLGAAAPALAQELAAPPVAFTLPTQPLDLALPAFAKQADVQVLYASNLVKGKRANAVIGTRPPAEALRDLLAGSGLKATATGPRTFLISVQENPVVAELEEVIVTAQKRSARIENVPIAVTVVEGGDAQRRGITNVVDLVDQVAGVSVNYAFGGTNYGLISIRGIGGADDYKPNGNPSVALHVDGVYQTSNAYLGMPLFDLDRIEVLEGPARHALWPQHHGRRHQRDHPGSWSGSRRLGPRRVRQLRLHGDGSFGRRARQRDPRRASGRPGSEWRRLHGWRRCGPSGRLPSVGARRGPDPGAGAG